MRPLARLLLLTVAIVCAAWTFPASALAAGAQDDGRAAAIALYREGKPDEAIFAFDKLLAEKPDDGRLKTWKALATVEKARMMKLRKDEGYKSLVAKGYGALKWTFQTQRDNPDWYLALAKAYLVNDRPQKARGAAGKALFFRSKDPEAHLVLADIALDEAENASPYQPGTPSTNTVQARFGDAAKAYQAVLDLPDLPPALRAEALYRLGYCESKLDGKMDSARDRWKKAAETAPASHFAKMAMENLSQKP